MCLIWYCIPNQKVSWRGSTSSIQSSFNQSKDRLLIRKKIYKAHYSAGRMKEINCVDLECPTVFLIKHSCVHWKIITVFLTIDQPPWMYPPKSNFFTADFAVANYEMRHSLLELMLFRFKWCLMCSHYIMPKLKTQTFFLHHDLYLI